LARGFARESDERRKYLHLGPVTIIMK
jgi:hypothetical protein